MEKMLCDICTNNNICKCNECINFYIDHFRADNYFRKGCLEDLKSITDNDCRKYTGVKCFKKIDWVDKIKYVEFLRLHEDRINGK